jgi:hypothetical protein
VKPPAAILKQYGSMFRTAGKRGMKLPAAETATHAAGGVDEYSLIVQKIERRLIAAVEGQHVPTLEADVRELEEIAALFRDAKAKAETRQRNEEQAAELIDGFMEGVKV